MKKGFFIAVMISVTAAIYANDNVSTGPVNPKVEKAFNEIFKGAINPIWSTAENTYKVTFTKGTTVYQVTFTETGDLKLITRIIAPEHLPIPVIEKLRTTFGFDDILSTHEYAYAAGPNYYLIPIRKEKHNVLLRFFSDGEYQKVKSIRRSN